MKKLILMLLCIALLVSLIPSMAIAETTFKPEDFPTTCDAPRNVGLSIRYNNSGGRHIESFKLGFTTPQTILDLDQFESEWRTAGITFTFLTEVDYKLNEGSWHYSADWDDADLAPDPYLWQLRVTDDPDIGYYVKIKDLTDLSNLPTELVNDTVYFRCRTVVSYYLDNQKYNLFSPWSETVAVGKNAIDATKNMEPPVLTEITLDEDEDGFYRLAIKFNTPDSIRAIDNGPGAVHIWREIRVNGGEWKAFNTAHGLDGTFHFKPQDVDPSGVIDIKAAQYEVRARFAYNPDSEAVNAWSPYSNIVSIGAPAYYKDASAWATPELQKAGEYGLIPDILKGADMTKPITREEFAEVALLMYQKASGITDTTPADPNPFNDTQNPQILKAYKLGIVKGTSATTFEPKKLINREQVAAMLVRTIKLIAPNADYSTTGAPTFTDQADISGWALNDCLYIAKLGIIKGSDGKFMPRAITQAQVAAGYANTSREQALAMSVRSVEKIDGIK